MIRLEIHGMTCGHCETAVRRALEAVDGVTRVVEVDREHRRAIVEGTPTIEALLEAVREEGYQAEVGR